MRTGKKPTPSSCTTRCINLQILDYMSIKKSRALDKKGYIPRAYFQMSQCLLSRRRYISYVY